VKWAFNSYEPIGVDMSRLGHLKRKRKQNEQFQKKKKKKMKRLAIVATKLFAITHI
jgi:hypothetical protein